jgi:uncharacterized protein
MLQSLRWLMFAVLLVLPARVGYAETVDGLPQPTGYVNDFAGVLSPDTKQNLEELCTEVDHQAHAQIAVVTVKSVDPGKDGTTPSIEEFATALEDKWKVGAKGTDKGVLMIFVASPPPMHGRIEVGYGLEGLLNDAKVGDIGREMKPILAAGDFNQGISLGVKEIAQDIATDAGVTLPGAGAAPTRRYRYVEQPQVQISGLQILVIGGIIVVVIGILIRTGHIGMLFFILFNLLGGGGGGRGGGGLGGGGGSNEGGGGFGGFGGGGSGGGGADF